MMCQFIHFVAICSIIIIISWTKLGSADRPPPATFCYQSNNYGQNGPQNVNNDLIDPSLVPSNFQPRQLHLSIKYDDGDKMTVTWSTRDLPHYSFVEYGLTQDDLTWSQDGVTNLLASRGPDTITGNLTFGSQYIHEVTLERLVPGKNYYYRCVSCEGPPNGLILYSKTYKFRQPLDGTGWSPNLLVFGDLGLFNPASLPFMEKEVNGGSIDALIHLGDIAYELHWNGGKLGDDYMNQIEVIAAKVPYQITPGNHELDFFRDYNEYVQRFRMPGDLESMTYSWNLGPVHFISINTEHHFHSLHKAVQQYRWLQKDLKKANEQRHLRPWIILYGHTPMYCSTTTGDTCQFANSSLRVGCGHAYCPGLEDLLFETGVDLLMFGHEHSYESLFPLYNFVVYNGSLQEHPYTNPRAPVHVTSGCSGNNRAKDFFQEIKPHWSRFRDIDFSYSRLKIFNATHLKFEQVSATTGLPFDSFTLIQENHGSFSGPGNPPPIY